MRPRHKKDITLLGTQVLNNTVMGIYLGYNNIDDDYRHCIAFTLETKHGKHVDEMRFQCNKDYIRKYWPEFINTHRFFFMTKHQFVTQNSTFSLYNEKPLEQILWDMEGETLQ